MSNLVERKASAVHSPLAYLLAADAKSKARRFDFRQLGLLLLSGDFLAMLYRNSYFT